MEVNKDLLESIIKKVIEEKNLNTVEEVKEHLGVRSADPEAIAMDKFDTGNPNDNVFLKDIFSLEESPRLGCGIMEMQQSTFDWFLNYDEIDYVIEGTLEVIIDGKKVVANRGEIILIPKGSKIKFSVPKYAKFLYTVFPANWEEQQ